MNEATFIKDVSERFIGRAGLWRLSTPLCRERWEAVGADEDDHTETVGYEYVIASAVVAMFSGPETYVFGADEAGNVLDWCELPGSGRGFLSQQSALRDAGYEPVGEGMPS